MQIILLTPREASFVAKKISEDLLSKPSRLIDYHNIMATSPLSHWMYHSFVLYIHIYFMFVYMDICTVMCWWLPLFMLSPLISCHPATSQRAHDALITSSLRQNDVAMSLWRFCDIIIALCPRWDAEYKYCTIFDDCSTCDQTYYTNLWPAL